MTWSWGSQYSYSPFSLAHEFEGAVGDDLVGVHVGGGAGAALEDVELELVVELAVDEVAAGGLHAAEDLRGRTGRTSWLARAAASLTMARPRMKSG